MDGGRPTEMHPPGSDSIPGSPSAPFLERRSNPDGLVQLLPRNYDERNRDAVKVRKDTTNGSVVTTPEPSQVVGGEATHAEALDLLKNAARISSRPHHIDIPPTTFGDMRANGPQTPGSVSLLSNASRTTPMEITPGLQVLVVDDDRMTRLLMTRMLERLRCVVTTAANGKQALQLLLGGERNWDTPAEEPEPSFPSDDREVPQDSASMDTMSKEGKFAITFLDNQMPIMSGVEMVRKLRALGRDDLIVGVTGNALLPDQEEYLDAGADQYVHPTVGHFLTIPTPEIFSFASILTKPVREEHLRGMLSVADERRKTRARDSFQSPLQLQLPHSPGELDDSIPTPVQ